MDDFYVGEYIMYVNGDRYELGRIKSLHPDGAFVAYHAGETGAKTPYDLMHKLVNGFVIQNTLLGGDYFIMHGIAEDLERLPSPQQNDCEYWDDESNFCALHRPSPQPEIIRCKECKYHTDEEPGAVYCPDRVGGWVSEDFFCKAGDRSIEDGCAVIPGSGADKPNHPECGED